MCLPIGNKWRNGTAVLCDDGAMPAGCASDLNGDGLVNDSDFGLFAVAYDTLLCP